VALLVLSVPGLYDDEHIVEPGDTLAAIAAKHGASVGDLVEANDLDDPNIIVVGEVLRIPGTDDAEPTYHIVQRGETLAQIATRYGTTTAKLAAANGIANIDRIISGTTLNVGAGAAGESGGDDRSDASAGSAGSDEPERGSDEPLVVGRTTSYIVQVGDTLSQLADRFGASVARLMRMNEISNANLIRSGQSLTVPGSGFVCPVAGAWYQNDWHFLRPGGRLHLGTDLFAPEGAPVVAPASGMVEQIDGSRGGLQFWLHGDDGVRYIGAHLASFGASGRVEAGDVLGYVGRTGNAKSTPPHLHFEISIDGLEYNPYISLEHHGC
jgi:murein DD-endopeptidase MepM/ murein hydrolase activator NlpD